MIYNSIVSFFVPTAWDVSMFHPSDEAYGLLGRVQSRIFFETYLPGVTKKTREGGHRCCECVFCLHP